MNGELGIYYGWKEISRRVEVSQSAYVSEGALLWSSPDEAGKEAVWCGRLGT